MRTRILVLLWVLIPGWTYAASYDAAFEAMSNDLDDPATSFEFVKAAIAEGDLQGAAAALERMLRIDPTLANIKLELGILYLRLGAPERARALIEEALASPDVPVWVRTRAKNLLVRADQEASRHSWSFNVTTSALYDDNANAAPVDGEVLVGGNPGLLDEDDTGRHDTSWDAAATLAYSYIFNSEAGSQFDVSLGTYNRRYDDSEEIDVDSVSIALGPRFYFGPVVNPGFSVYPYFTASRLDLASDKYLERLGGGVNVRYVFLPSLQGDLYVEYADQDYFDSDTRLAADRSGDQYAVRGLLYYLLTPRSMLTMGAMGGVRDAEVEWEQRDEYGISLAYSHALTVFESARPWQLTLRASAEKVDYDAADPAVDPTTSREDDRYVVGLSLSVPVARRFSLLLGTSYTDVNSSLPNYQYDNWGGSLGLRIAF